MVDLARAYDIKINPDAPKSQLLPSLIGAEQNGAFNGEPVRPAYLKRAMRTSDDPYIELPTEAPGAPTHAYLPPAEASDDDEVLGKLGAFHLLKKLCKAEGIPTHGKNKLELLEALTNASIGKAQAQPDRRGQAGGLGQVGSA